MTSIDIDKKANNLPLSKLDEEGLTHKPFHQHFTLYFQGIFLLVLIALASALWFSFQQYKYSQTLLNEQLAPLQGQFLQQTYLINSNKVIDEILQNVDTHSLVSLQQSLSLHSKKLSLLTAKHKSIYQQWFSENNLATNLVTRIESSHARNELLKNNALIQLDTLLDAIKIQSDKRDIDALQAKLLLELQHRLTTIVTMFKQLNLHTPIGAFGQLNKQLDEMFVMDYSKLLSEQQGDSQIMADIVRDFIRFEDFILKRSLLVKWQGQLRLMGDYQLQLVAQQQQLQSILYGLSSENQADHPLIKNYVSLDNNEEVLKRLSLWQSILSVVILAFFASFLWFIRLKIKATSQYNVNCINRALGGEKPSDITYEEQALSVFNSRGGFCAESQQLINKIERINNSHFSEIDYRALIDENKNLADEVVNESSKYTQLKSEFDLVELNAMAKTKSQLLLEQQHGKSLQLAVLKQLVFLGCSALTTTQKVRSKPEVNEDNNYLFLAYLQARDSARELSRASCYRYLQSNDAVLTFSDVNLVSQIQAVLFNLSNKLAQFENTISLTIDEKIITNVNLDAELFAELLNVYIRLLFAQQKQMKLELSLRLTDKNEGQQMVSFTGHISTTEQLVELPKALKSFNDDSIEFNEQSDYFNTLLRCQHGNDSSVKLMENGYLFRFTLPLTVVNNLPKNNYPALTIPWHLADITSVCEKLTAKYLAMPITVLLAVKQPVKYQRLQQVLQSMGLQITWVSSDILLQKYWQSGRYAILMTEFPCQPFTNFTADDGGINSVKATLIRGVFSLGSLTALTQKSDEYRHWKVGELTADSAVSELITAMLPWLQERKNSIADSDKTTQVNNISQHVVNNEQVESAVLTSSEVSASFNFQRYLKNQGSAELAIYMLEEYTSENTLLVNNLKEAMAMDDVAIAETAIKALLVNGKILAADDLISLCKNWQKLLNNHGLDNNDKKQLNLLNNTMIAIDAIAEHATAIA